MQKSKFDDVTYWVEDKLLYVELPSYRAQDLADKLRLAIITLARKIDESHGHRAAGEYVAINRASRMAYELETNSRISAIDHLDETVLYTLKAEEATEWLFQILNQTRNGLLVTSLGDILMADAAIKSMHEIMAA